MPSINRACCKHRAQILHKHVSTVKERVIKTFQVMVESSLVSFIEF